MASINKLIFGAVSHFDLTVFAVKAGLFNSTHTDILKRCVKLG